MAATQLASIAVCLGGVSALELAREGAELRAAVRFHRNRDTPLPAQKGKVKPSILTCAGGDNPIMPQEQITFFMQEIRDAGTDWEMNSHRAAGRNFINNFAYPARIPRVAHPKTADKRSWQAPSDVFVQTQRGQRS